MTRDFPSKVLVLVALAATSAYGQTNPGFDTTGNSLLSGSYFVRMVAFDKLTATAHVGHARSVSATVAFDGTGGYTLSGQISDSTVSSGQPSALNVTGTYQISSGGLVQMTNPIAAGETLNGGVGVNAVVASTTESNTSRVWDLLIGVPVPSSPSSASLQGSYRFVGIDFTNADVGFVRDYTFLASANGQGSLGTLSVVGAAANLGNTDVTQNVSGAQYSLSGTGPGTLTFPAPSGATMQSQFLMGTKQFAISSDGNVALGGSLTGYDVLIGIKAFSGAATNSSFSGVFYSGGLDDDVSDAQNNYLDAFYGSINANGLGTIISHQRTNPSDINPYDYTFDTEVTIAPDASFTNESSRFYLGSGGQTALAVGRSSLYSLEFSVAAHALAPSGSVYLNPLAVLNAASYSPITGSIAPGEFLIAYGTNLASGNLVAQSLPLPTTLGGTSVTVNGRPAPIYSATANQIVFLVPYATVETYAQIIVTNNGTASNPVTLYVADTALGVFTATQNGVGPGAITHANGQLVTASNPARTGETVIAYLAGLGAVTPAVADGAAAPASPLAQAPPNTVGVLVDKVPATVSFAGLAPGYAGLYQINFVIPADVGAGAVYLDVYTAGAYTSQALISVSK